VVQIGVSEIEQEPQGGDEVCYNSITGDTTYRDGRFVDEKLFRARLDGALTYLQLLLQPPDPPERRLGFPPPTGGVS